MIYNEDEVKVLKTIIENTNVNLETAKRLIEFEKSLDSGKLSISDYDIIAGLIDNMFDWKVISIANNIMTKTRQELSPKDNTVEKNVEKPKK